MLIVLSMMLALLVAFGIARLRPSWSQCQKEVAIREPGSRVLGLPKDAADEAAACIDYAIISLIVYRSCYPHRVPRLIRASANELRRRGWHEWEYFVSRKKRKTDTAASRAISRTNLHVEVWSREDPPEVVVAFTGTYFVSLRDWLTNLRWFFPLRYLPGFKDQYMTVAETVGKKFIDEFKHLAGLQSRSYLNHARIIATGHSLGGGLAQHFAYSLPLDDSVPRVSHVYGFDPSPVTGFFSVAKATRERNAKHLKIDRIYERGEILAAARMILAILLRPSRTRPLIRELRFSLCDSINPITNHSVPTLVRGLRRLSRPVRRIRRPAVRELVH